MTQRSKKKSRPDHVRKLSVRFYFDLGIACLIPSNPFGRREHVTDAAWERRKLEEVLEELAASLGQVSADVAYRWHARDNAAPQLYAAQFAVSVVQDLEMPVSGRGDRAAGGSPRKLRAAAAQIEARIRDALKATWVLNSLSFEYAAAWDFVFEVTIAGRLEIKHSFARGDIDAAGGSVRDAVEGFNDEVVASLELAGFIATPRNTARKAKDSIYKFDIQAVNYWSLSEPEVSGNLSLMSKGSGASDLPMLEIRRGSQSFAGHVESARNALETHDFPTNSDLVGSTLEITSYDEEVVDCIDALANL